MIDDTFEELGKRILFCLILLGKFLDDECLDGACSAERCDFIMNEIQRIGAKALNFLSDLFFLLLYFFSKLWLIIAELDYTEAITAKVKEEFAAKEKGKKAAQGTAKTAKKVAA